MIQKTAAFFALLWSAFSCSQPDEPMHSSYGTLTGFLKQENVYQKLAIEKINVDHLAIVDLKDYRPDNKRIRFRNLEVTYDLTVTARGSVYQAKAAINSADSINWRMRSLLLQRKADSANIVTETTYGWELNGADIKRTSTKRVTKPEA